MVAVLKICAPNPKGKASSIPTLCEDLISSLQVCCMAASGCWRVAETKADTFSLSSGMYRPMLADA